MPLSCPSRIRVVHVSVSISSQPASRLGGEPSAVGAEQHPITGWNRGRIADDTTGAGIPHSERSIIMRLRDEPPAIGPKADPAGIAMGHDAAGTGGLIGVEDQPTAVVDGQCDDTPVPAEREAIPSLIPLQELRWTDRGPVRKR